MNLLRTFLGSYNSIASLVLHQYPPKRTAAAPRIGYKVADISKLTVDNGTVTGIEFTGVAGTAYKVNDHARNLSGFHMYSSLRAAEDHPQEAEFLLEVLGYGEVAEHEDGYVTSDQRVLQVIVAWCWKCDSQATRIYLDPDGSAFSACNDHWVFTMPWVSVRTLARNTHVIDGCEVVFSALMGIRGLPKVVPTTMPEEHTGQQARS